MQTSFTLAQLADPDIAEANSILRSCVHCGFCTATCPTYLLLGDELDSPRGRIYLIKEMLENDRPATEKVTKHIDRCLSCLSCMTTCPSGVHYMHLVDHARRHIQETYRRPLHDRLLRWILARLVPYPGRFRLSILGAWYGKMVFGLIDAIVRVFVFPAFKHSPNSMGTGTGFWARARAIMMLSPNSVAPPSRVDRPQVHPAEGERRGRVALLTGCAQQVLAPQINEATVRLLTRRGIEVVVARGAGCCGSLVHHMGLEDEALAQARANVAAWEREDDIGGLDAIAINASGCGTTVKDYGFMLREDPVWAARAERISALAKDISEVLIELGPEQGPSPEPLTVAYHAACSLQHGQKVTAAPKTLLAAAGFAVKEVPEGHICCGSAGTYNMLQPDLAGQLLTRKVGNIEKTAPDVIATGNIGCMTQIAQGTAIPVVHTVELLDWAAGGPKPAVLPD